MVDLLSAITRASDVQRMYGIRVDTALLLCCRAT